MPLIVMPGDSDRVGESVRAMGLELKFAYRRLLSAENQLVLDDIPVLGFGDLAGRDESEQFFGDHYSLSSVLFPSGWPTREPLTEAGMSLHVSVSTVTQYLGWDIIQKRGKVLILELGVLLIGRGVVSGKG